MMKAHERNRRYRKVLTLRSQKKTFKEIGDELKVSRARAHQIYQDALNDGRPMKRSRPRIVAPKQRRTRSIRRAIGVR